MSQVDFNVVHRRWSQMMSQADNAGSPVARRFAAVAITLLGAAAVVGAWYSPTYVRNNPDAPAAIMIKNIASTLFSDNPRP